MAAPRMRDVLEALEWVRGEMWRFSSPDFIRQREMERRVGDLCAKLLGPEEGTGKESRGKLRLRSGIFRG